MKNHSIKSIIIVGGLSLAAVSTVFASEAEDTFKRMDLNGDKKVTSAEHAQFAELSFQQSDADHDGKVSAAECEAAQATYDKKAKIDKKATEAHLRQVLLDAQWQKCEADKAGGEKTVVVMTNPAPTEGSSKVFSGTIRRKDLENAAKNCAGGGKIIGASLVVVGAATGVDSTGQLGQGIYEYSGVGCGDLNQAIGKGNVMALLGPTAIVGHAEQARRLPCGRHDDCPVRAPACAAAGSR